MPQREFDSVPHLPNVIFHNVLSGADLSSDLLVFQALGHKIDNPLISLFEYAATFVIVSHSGLLERLISPSGQTRV